MCTHYDMTGEFVAGESGLLAVFMDPGARVSLREFHEWYDNEHVPLRVERFATFRSAARYAVTSSYSSSAHAGEKGPPSGWLALYTVSENDTFAHEAYTSLRTQRSEREAELFTRLAIVDRRIYKLEYDSDAHPELLASVQGRSTSTVGLNAQPAAEINPYIVTNSVDMVDADHQTKYNTWWEEEHVPMLAAIPAWRRSRRFVLLDNGVTGVKAEGDAHLRAIPRTLGLHEYAADGIEDTPQYKAACSTEWRLRVLGPSAVHLERRERRACHLYRAWDPTAALTQ